MIGNVSVEEAIRKGQRMVNYPAMAIWFGTICVAVYIANEHLEFGYWIAPLGIILSFVFAWIYWSIMITKWRIWAFENVRNVHELKKRAIQEKLIWKDDSIWNKTEIRNLAENEKWLSLQDKFEDEDLFEEDFTIPNETIIFYSKKKSYIELCVCLAVIGIGVYMIETKNSVFLAYCIIIICAIGGLLAFRRATNSKPQVIISNNGIQTISTEFHEWEDISFADVIRKGYGRNEHYYLAYEFPDGYEELMIDELDIDRQTLNKLLMLYQGRYYQKHERL